MEQLKRRWQAPFRATCIVKWRFSPRCKGSSSVVISALDLRYALTLFHRKYSTPLAVLSFFFKGIKE
jgi:hypothetical protein